MKKVRKSTGVKLQIILSPETVHIMDQLAETLRTSRSAVVSQAVMRWLHSDPLFKNVKIEGIDGNNHVGV